MTLKYRHRHSKYEYAALGAAAVAAIILAFKLGQESGK